MALLYTQELADRAQAWLSRPLTTGPEGKRSAEGLLELATIWAAINQAPLPECRRQCQYSERCYAITVYLQQFSRLQTPETMSDSNYQLAPGYENETLTHDAFPGTVTRDNLTDEAAKFFIEKGMGYAFTKNGKPLPKKKGEADEPEPAANPDLVAEQEAHTATKQALDSEKDAHTETKKQLAEVQHQLETSQKDLAKATAKSDKAK